MDRNSLPFREKTELFLLNDNGNIIVEDHNSYLMFPGGGVDEHEKSIETSAIRELKEETGFAIIGNLEYRGAIEWDWFPSWANNPKRKRRYQNFRGERVHLFVGRAKELIPNTQLDEEDSWKNIDGLPLEEAILKHMKYSTSDHENTKGYREAQIDAIHYLKSLI